MSHSIKDYTGIIVLYALISCTALTANIAKANNILTTPSHEFTLNSDKEIIQKAKLLRHKLAKAAKEQLIPGMIFYVMTPTKNYTMTYGTNTIGKRDIPGVNDYFRIGSNTKSMICAVIIQLAQENALSLNDPISKYISDIPNGEKITLKMLMQNRSGLYNYTEDPDFVKDYSLNPSKIFLPQELLDFAFKHPMLFSPGEKFYYCNTNFILLGMVAEKIEKQPLATIFNIRLFKPLGMRNTYLPTQSDNTLKNPYTHGYLYGDSVHVFYGSPYSKKERLDVKKRLLKPLDYTTQNASWAWAAGGVVSTAHDLAIWIQSLSNGKLFDKEYYQQWQQAFKRVEPNNHFVEYGYGTFLRTRGNQLSNAIYFHHGHLPGYNSYMVYDPVKKITIIVWVNLGMSLNAHAPADAIIQISINELLLNQD